MRIAVLASLLGVEATGQSAVPALTAARLAHAGDDVSILATDCAVGGGPVQRYVQVDKNVHVHIFPSVGKLNRRLFRSPALTAWLSEHVGEFDVLDVQGIWSVVGKDAAEIFARASKPYVLTPHGMMTRYDWQKSMIRRRLFFALGFGKVWRNADAVRFLSRGEQEQSFYPVVRRTAIISNFVDLQMPSSLEQKAEARVRLQLPAEVQILLFLGRLTHQKGIKEILAAFDLAAAKIPDLLLCLVGPQEGLYGQQICEQASSSAFSSRILLLGAVFGEAKYDYLRAADAFITLSHNEGQSVAHLESMSAGLPMILSGSSNMDKLTEYGAGVLTTHDAVEASDTIVRVFSDKSALRQMGRNARHLVEEHYVPDIVIPQLRRLYRELIESRHADTAKRTQ